MEYFSESGFKDCLGCEFEKNWRDFSTLQMDVATQMFFFQLELYYMVSIILSNRLYCGLQSLHILGHVSRGVRNGLMVKG